MGVPSNRRFRRGSRVSLALMREEVVPSTPPDPAPLDLSIVMPCLNEEQTIGACIEKATEGLRRRGLR